MAGRSEPKVFISYRREDSAPMARSLSQELMSTGTHRVHVDGDAISPGAGYRAVVESALAGSRVVLALIGANWLSAVDGTGGRRLDDPNDAIVWEIRTAFRLGIPIIPVLVDGAVMPTREQLPESVAELVDRQAVRLGYRAFRVDVLNLIQAIGSVARTIAPSPPAHAPPDPSTARSEAPGVASARTAFISYRRTVSWSTARLVLRDLKDHGVDAFMDIDNIDSGEFERVILTQIAARAHFIVVLEPGSLDRISASDDWLRREIAHAITLERNIVPLTCNGFRLDRDVALPVDIARLRSFNAVSVPHDYFDEAMQKLRRRFLQLPETPSITPAPAATEGTVRAKIARALGFDPPR